MTTPDAKTLTKERLAEIESWINSGHGSGYMIDLFVALRAAESERDQAKSLVEQLAEVLEQLRDLQNGCPLPKYLKEWTAAMKAADAALAAAGERG